jgi:phosphoserine aminotransferase
MSDQRRPVHRPTNINFSSGPCAKRPGWTPNVLSSALLGRSHRSSDGRARLKLAIEKTKDILGLPSDYRVAIVPGSDTGAFEMAMWSMLGARGVDVLAWESFGRVWLTDIVKQLKRGRLLARRCLHLERHHVRSARSECELDTGHARWAHPD